MALRAAVFAAVTGSDAAETDQALDPTRVEAAIDAHGVVHLSSGGRASDLLRGRVLIEMRNAQLIGTWRRLKVCHNARCHEVFFDQSKNDSRTWFDTDACANAGGPTADKPTVSFQPPADADLVSHAMTLRVADCHAVYEALRSKGAAFLTPPYDWGPEIRCFLQDPDGHLVEISEAKAN